MIKALMAQLERNYKSHQAAMRDREEVDHEYLEISRRTEIHVRIDSPVERFVSMCKDLIAGFEIAIKIKDDELTHRYWISDLLERFTWIGSIYSCKDMAFSEADSQKMAAAFAPIIPLMNKWAEGRPIRSDAIDFETGTHPYTFAGRINCFLWLYNSLVSKGHSPVSAIHPVLFVEKRREREGVSYSFRRQQFQELAALCEQYRKHHAIRTENDELFAKEMRKPPEERFFNIPDDEDEVMYEDGDGDSATQKSRLKAYFRYRVQIAGLREHRFKAGSGFDEVKTELARRIDALERGVMLGASEMELRNASPNWYELLDQILRIRPWISYRDFNTDAYDEADKNSDAGYHSGDGWDYFEVDEDIPECEICRDIDRKLRRYVELLAGVSYFVRSNFHPKLAAVLQRLENGSGFTDWGYFEYDERPLKDLISALKKAQDQLGFEVRMFRVGAAAFGQPEGVTEKQMAAAFDKHTTVMKTELDRAHVDADKSQQMLETLIAQGADTGAVVLSQQKMMKSFVKRGIPGKVFGFAEQKTCYELWEHNRSNPMIVAGHKIYRADVFEHFKDRLEKIGVTHVKEFEILIDRYIKRTGTKVLGNRKRKTESGNGKRKTRAGKRKTARGKRKSTPGKRKPK